MLDLEIKHVFGFDKYPGFLTVKLSCCKRDKLVISVFQQFLFYLQQERVVCLPSECVVKNM